MKERFLPLSILSGFVVALAAVISIGILGYRSLRAQTANANQITHTFEVRSQIEGLLAALTNAETGQRGFLLTGEESYLEPYERGRTEGPAHYQSLRTLTADNLAQQERLASLQPLIDDKLTELARTIELRRTGYADAANAVVRSNQGKATMDRIRTLLDQVQATERELLNARTSEWEQTTRSTFIVVEGGSALLLVLIVGALFMTSRDYRARSEQTWLKSGQSELAAEIGGNLTPGALAEKALAFLARYLGAAVAAAYIVDSDSKLTRLAGFALAGGDGAPLRIARGEGLAGQAAVENRILEVANVPADYLRVSSAVGAHAPLHLIVAPLQADGSANGVVEFGFFRPARKAERELLEMVASQLGLALQSAQDRERVSSLLEETQRQSEELQTQQEELRVSNEELTEQSRALQEAHVRLENQQAELEQTNAHLEEQSSALEQQKSALEEAQVSLTRKATELERASAYKSEFLANMSHELRTPLNSSLILSKLLADNKSGNLTSEQIQFAETIHSAGRDLLNLINDILDLAKIEAGKADVHVVKVSMTRITEPLQRTFAPVAAEKHLIFTVHVDPDVPFEIETDEQRLQQILKNLLSNAFKFTDRGNVALRVSAAADDRIAFAVRDSGIGIEPGQQQQVFEPFHQADGGTTRKHGGTGLGLSISRDLARLLGGDLTLESTPALGSTFTLRIPRSLQPGMAASAQIRARAVEAPPPIVPAAAAATASDANTADVDGERTLLVIEDDPAFARIVADLGREQGFHVWTASSADEGVRLARKHLPTAIVLDIGLPDHSGLAVLDQLKRNSATRHIPIHVVSSHDQAQTALEMGAIGYMLKPVHTEQLVDVLRRVASRSQQVHRQVLVVEDDPAQRDSIIRLLSAENVEITGVSTAADALYQLGSTTYDCMVMDLKLPDGSGFELLEKIGAEDSTSFPPVIVYTGRELSRDDEQRLRRYSRSIIIKDARSPERLLDEVTLFLHQVESRLSPERQRMLKEARNREALFDGKRILVVEDDVRNIFALSRVLEPKGARIEIARNGREAVEALGKLGNVDLVLMDIMMPEMDGYQAMREIRKDEKWADLPIIALTAKAMRDDQEKCLQAGASDYIAKPLDVEKLLSLARVWMSR